MDSIMDGIQAEIKNSGFCEVGVTYVATEVSANALDKCAVTVKVLSFKEAAYLIEGLISGTLRVRIVPGEEYK